MRICLTIAAAFLATPLAAQDHGSHGSHGTTKEQAGPESTEAPAVDHCAMGHMPPEKCPPKTEAPAKAPAMPAMDHSGMDHSKMDHGAHGSGMDKSAPGAAPESAIPARALEGPRHAADAIWGESAMAPAREELAESHGAMKTGMVMIERLEGRFDADGGEDGFVWDAQAFYGGDITRVFVKTEGEGELGGAVEDAEVQLLYSRAITPFFDLQAGARLDLEPDTRTHLALGIQGLAPYMFHVDAALFLADTGDLTARVEGEYDQKITQRLILQPRLELEAAAQDIPEREIGAGLTKLEAGLRLRYEIAREFAPYVGIEYETKLGQTADIARAAGDDPDGLKLLVGLRAWF